MAGCRPVRPPIHFLFLVQDTRLIWSSGAVLRGLEGNQIKHRLARGHYGVCCADRYNPEQDSAAEKYWCPFEEVWKVDNHMSWIIRKGSTISENNPIQSPFYRVRDCQKSGPMVFREELYFSASDAAPKRMSNGE